MAPRPPLAALAALALLLSSCAALHEAAAARRCTPDAAFSNGVNDAMAGKEMEPAYGESCDATDPAPLRAAYREGYLSALARSPARAPAAAERGWTCEVTAFGDRFVEAGPTEAQAAARAREACQARQDPMFCRDVACRQGK